MANDSRSDIVDNFYSLILDESTNVSNIQSLGIAKIADTMYRFISIESATAAALNKKVVGCLGEDNLSISKMIGIGYDSVSTMVGRNYSVATLLI